MAEDINEASFNKLLTSLTNNDVVDPEYASTLLVIKEYINQINYKILSLNKKSKKNTRSLEYIGGNSIVNNYVQKR
ncbi:IMV protein [Eptesipox virus]|uniref:IMV protein n=1 Tax=Eptesipox virus TaxID=1329402 RepID=A0A220T6J4_9POXV|nr:IMV protein [Eptesipox virus]ASK51328.1 IMV protein [Eptesipox virus]WAH71086.1 IMV protein [Eptesipox virus]